MPLRPLLPVLFAALLTLQSPVRADELTVQKRADIEQLLVASGALAVAQQMSTAMTASIAQMLRSARPDIPQEVLDLLPAEVSAVVQDNIQGLKTEMIPLYHRHYNASEIKELLGFYASPIGRKSVAVMPLMAQEGMVVGQRWGQALGPKIEQRIKARLKQKGIAI